MILINLRCGKYRREYASLLLFHFSLSQYRPWGTHFEGNALKVQRQVVLLLTGNPAWHGRKIFMFVGAAWVSVDNPFTAETRFVSSVMLWWLFLRYLLQVSGREQVTG